MVRKVAAKVLLGLVIGLVLAFPMTASATAVPSIESPGDGQTVTGANVNVHVTGTGQCGISRARLLLEGQGISGSKEVWTTGADARPKNLSLDESFTLNVLSHSKYNGSFQLTLLVKEWVSGTINCTESGSWASESRGFKMDMDPAAPAWLSGYPSAKIVDSAPEITAKWKANSEPDLTSYQITRSSSGADFIDDLTPGAVCRSGTCTYVDKQFAGSGYGDTYTYSIKAFRKGSSGSELTSSPAKRSVTVEEKAPPPPTNNGGSGGSGSGGSGGSNGGATGGGSNSDSGGISQNGGAVDPATQGLSADGGAPGPVTPGQSLPGGGNSGEFFTGEYSSRLPYQERHLLVPGAGQTTTKSRTVASGPTYADSINAMKMLIPIAGGLLFITLAAHARRMLRDK